ncbi:hypothetical protein [Halorussus sp. MSC15.2]|uniref:hypothetical protein n=1 Tax=Halorussus sp. MSC15.2 TaxID=2283638 RepID=UPI0013D00F3D|nr:hypothetical protein [Halorussus sp. MSC15.2]NEU59227.1 hypothetical protein [Halorussus sp. MSC15.2]
MPDIVSAIKSAILGIFKTLLEPIIELLKGVVETGLEIILYTPVPKRCVEGASQSYPDCPSVVALVQQPANAPWSSVYETAWTEVLPTAVTILFVLYLVIRVVETIPAISRKKTHQARTSIFGALVVLPFSWPFGAGVLAFFAGLTKALAPTPDEFLPILTTQLTALIGAAATPGGNVLALGISGLDGAIIIGAVLAYLFRILFLIFVMQYIHLFAVIYLLDVPVLKGIATKIFEVFIAMAFLPLLVAGMFDFATTLFSSEGSLTFLPQIGDFVKAIISMILPLASLGLYYLSLKGAMLSGMSKALGTVESAANGTAVGELGEASSDEYGGLVEEKAAQLEERVQQGTQATARTAMTKSKYAAQNPRKAGRQTKTATKNAPGKARNMTKSGVKSVQEQALSAYENVPKSASQAMKQLGVKSRDLDDVDREEIGGFGESGADSQNLASQMTTRTEKTADLPITSTLGSVQKAGKSMESLVEDVQTPTDGIDASESYADSDGPEAVGPEQDAVRADEEAFARVVAESNLSRDGAQVLLENIKDEYGEGVMRQTVDEASYIQLAREAGREQAQAQSLAGDWTQSAD